MPFRPYFFSSMMMQMLTKLVCIDDHETYWNLCAPHPNFCRSTHSTRSSNSLEVEREPTKTERRIVNGAT